ncbi:hypothetical protein [Pseudoduganella violacea]|uniref:3-oxoacyl-[acyl-carrier-protein] synthase-3 n=1 Tax=Pseudoduganella violacea TaxID=1715466 RepID=A0A7W5B6Z5_9BURK|nr:hypothetical protein [Pseudoduganella violacea]MBB3117581.1 3-oxoacyl-[acyl-carrier-protein] synthase-3 [Pseudoduganella violacea]
MKRDAYLSGASYVLGEAEKTFKQADGFEQALTALGGANFPELWGWGSYYETADIYQLSLQAAQTALAASAVPAGDIQLVVFAAASFPENPNELAPRLGQVLQTLGCRNALLESATLNGCASYLSAVRLAAARIASGELENVLVVGLGSMTPGMQRFSPFALFGDAACAVVLRADGANAQYRVVDAIQRLDLDELASGITLNDKSQLQTQTLDALLERNQLGRSDISRVFNNNIFLPIKKIRDARSGFKAAQLYTGNVARIGHCHVCDSMINLIDYSSQHATATSELLLLQSDGNGHCACLLLTSI